MNNLNDTLQDTIEEQKKDKKIINDLNETLSLLVKNVQNLTDWMTFIHNKVHDIEREIEIDSYCSYELDFSQGSILTLYYYLNKN